MQGGMTWSGVVQFNVHFFFWWSRSLHIKKTWPVDTATGMAMRSQAADSVKLELVEDSRDEVEGWGIQNNQWDGFCYLDWLVLDCPFFWIFSLLMWSGRPYCFSNSAAAIATTPTDPARASCRHPHFGHIIASLFLLLFFLDLRSFQMFPTVYPKVPVYMFLSVFSTNAVPSSGLGFPGIYVQQGLDSEPKTPQLQAQQRQWVTRRTGNLFQGLDLKCVVQFQC